nr:UDP-2,4-diacetamido-2,4,6-trideoxy-beta-L-altropyranose hydrolase [Salinivibrio socompensis]
MKVVFRVDASVWIGSGHVMRCLVLADELAKNGHDVTFACLPLEGDMRAFIGERGFNVITLTAPDHVVKPAHDADYVAWLPKLIPDDAHDFINHVHEAEVVVTDHYAIEKQWHEIVRARLNCNIVAIDDLVRTHSADIIIDQTLGRQASDYQALSANVLAGSDYALLSRPFSRQRECALSRTLTCRPPRVLISMGGIDAPNATLTVLKAIHPHVNVTFTVLLSSRAPHYHEVKQWCSNHDNVSHVDFVADMASLMMSHDMAIGAPGTTSWERACLGLPNILVPLADNQKMVCEQLVKHNAAIKVTLDEIPTRLLHAYQSTLNQWEAFKSANLALCDGRGVKRAVFELEQLCVDNVNSYRLERACSQQDIELVYQWQCHPNTRKYALNPNTPTWEEHYSWMSTKLQAFNDYFYMITARHSGKKVGAIRLDRQRADHYLVSIFIHPNNYGQGIGAQALAIIDIIHPDVTVHATVLKENIPSQRLFQKAGYQQTDEETYIRYPIQ